MNAQEMDHIITQATSTFALGNPSEYIISLNPLLNTTEGRKFLASQHGEKGLALVELLDWGLQACEISFNKGRAFSVLRRLCANLETLPKSCILEIEFNPDFPCYAVGEFADVWKGTYREREVTLKSIRVGMVDEDARERKRRFAQEVVLWKNVNHPNIHGLIGVCCWDSTPDARLIMVSAWMPNGNIIEYVERNESRRMELLIDCAKGIEYLHRADIVHGDLKGANILITSDNPVHARLTDLAFTTIVHDESEVGGGMTLFMAPELLRPSMFGMTKCRVSKEADVYAFGMVILQVLTGLMPFHTLRDAEIADKVIQGDHPAMPSNACGLGISDGLWELLVRCWDAGCIKRPQIKRVLQHLCQETARGLVFPPSRPFPSSKSPVPERSHGIAETFVNAESQPNQRLVNVLDKGGYRGMLEEGIIPFRDQPKFLNILGKMCRRLKSIPDSMHIGNCLDGPVDENCDGGFATVSRGEYQGHPVAIKKLRLYLTSDLEECFSEFRREAVAWRHLRHPNILPFIGVNLERHRLAMVSEWMDHGNINQFVKKSEGVNRVQLLVDAANGLEYMHSIHMVHGDLKGANILINQSLRACLADFGLSTIVSTERHAASLTSVTSKSSLMSFTAGGTPRWMSPELLDPDRFGITDSRPTKQSDCYALGMVVYEVLCGNFPYLDITNPPAVIHAIMRGDRPQKPEGAESFGFTDELWRVVRRCWLVDVSERPDVRDVLFQLNHATWFWNTRRLK